MANAGTTVRIETATETREFSCPIEASIFAAGKRCTISINGLALNPKRGETGAKLAERLDRCLSLVGR